MKNIASPTAPRRMGLPLFFEAAGKGDVATLRKALEKHPEWAHAKTAVGFTALALAVRAGRAECVEALLPHSDPAQFFPGGDRNTLLMIAAGYGDAPCVRALLGRCDPLAVNQSGETALMFAARAAGAGGVECARALLPVSDARAANRSKETALMMSVRASGLECARALLPAGDANAADDAGSTALARAAAQGFVDIAEALLPASDPAKTNNAGKTAFDLAAGSRKWAVVDLLASSAPREKAEKMFAVVGVGAKRKPRWARLLAQEEADNIAEAMRAPEARHAAGNGAATQTALARPARRM